MIINLFSIFFSFSFCFANSAKLETFNHSLGYQVKYSKELFNLQVDTCCELQDIEDALGVLFMKSPEFNLSRFEISSLSEYSKEHPKVPNPLELNYSKRQPHSNSICFKKETTNSIKRIVNVLEIGGYKDEVRWEVIYFCPKRGFQFTFLQKFTEKTQGESKIPAPQDLKIPEDIQKVMDTFKCIDNK